MLRTTIDVIELADGSITMLLDTDRFRPGDEATDGELRVCRAIHAATKTLMNQEGTVKLFRGWQRGRRLPTEEPIQVRVTA